jgi:hypothetical protein
MSESFLVPLTSACRHAARTISSSSAFHWRSGVWPLRILRAAIHSTSEIFNSLKSLFREVLASIHDGDHLGKTFEARSFYRSERMRLEKLHNLIQLFDASNSKLLPITMIGGDLTESEEPLQLL